MQLWSISVTKQHIHKKEKCMSSQIHLTRKKKNERCFIHMRGREKMLSPWKTTTWQHMIPRTCLSTAYFHSAGQLPMRVKGNASLWANEVHLGKPEKCLGILATRLQFTTFRGFRCSKERMRLRNKHIGKRKLPDMLATRPVRDEWRNVQNFCKKPSNAQTSARTTLQAFFFFFSFFEKWPPFLTMRKKKKKKNWCDTYTASTHIAQSSREPTKMHIHCF